MSETDHGAYITRSWELKCQQAGLEVVTHIRQAIDSEYMQRRYKGDFGPDEMRLNVRISDNPAGHFPIGIALWYTLQGKSLPEQKRILEGILAPHVRTGDMPEFRIGQAERDEKTHLVIFYNFPL